MKVLIVSDTHGKRKNLEEALALEKPVDMLIHLGDVEGDEYYIEALAECPVHMVAGNNDFRSDLPWEEEFELEGHRIFITHGHGFLVGLNEDRLNREARNRQADIVMYGHLHVPALSEEDGLITLCPGSISFPRQYGRRPTYMVMDIQKGKKPEIELKYM